MFGDDKIGRDVGIFGACNINIIDLNKFVQIKEKVF